MTRWPAMMLQKTAAAYVELSVKILCTNSAIFAALDRKTAANRAKYLGRGWKTIRAGMTRQRHPALQTRERTA